MSKKHWLSDYDSARLSKNGDFEQISMCEITNHISQLDVSLSDSGVSNVKFSSDATLEDKVRAYFPFKNRDGSPSFRKHQEDATITSVTTKKKFTVINAPVGFGKTSTAYAYIRALGGGVYITAQKALQDQLLNEGWPSVSSIKGSSSYSCPYVNYEQYDKLVAKKIPDIKCNFDQDDSGIKKCMIGDDGKQLTNIELISTMTNGSTRKILREVATNMALAFIDSMEKSIDFENRTFIDITRIVAIYKEGIAKKKAPLNFMQDIADVFFNEYIKLTAKYVFYGFGTPSNPLNDTAKGIHSFVCTMGAYECPKLAAYSNLSCADVRVFNPDIYIANSNIPSRSKLITCEAMVFDEAHTIEDSVQRVFGMSIPADLMSDVYGIDFCDTMDSTGNMSKLPFVMNSQINPMFLIGMAISRYRNTIRLGGSIADIAAIHSSVASNKVELGLIEDIQKYLIKHQDLDKFSIYYDIIKPLMVNGPRSIDYKSIENGIDGAIARFQLQLLAIMHGVEDWYNTTNELDIKDDDGDKNKNTDDDTILKRAAKLVRFSFETHMNLFSNATKMIDKNIKMYSSINGYNAYVHDGDESALVLEFFSSFYVATSTEKGGNISIFNTLTNISNTISECLREQHPIPFIPTSSIADEYDTKALNKIPIAGYYAVTSKKGKMKVNTIIPVDIGYIMRKHFYDNAKHVLLMSGTWIDRKSVFKIFGIPEDDVEYIEVPPIFDKKRRPFIVCTGDDFINFSSDRVPGTKNSFGGEEYVYAHTDYIQKWVNQLQKTIKAVRAFACQMSGGKEDNANIVLHSFTKMVKNLILEYIKGEPSDMYYWLCQGAYNDDPVINRHTSHIFTPTDKDTLVRTMRELPNTGLNLVSYSMNEGVDFKYQAARAQIIVKCPTLMVGDTYIQARMRGCQPAGLVPDYGYYDRKVLMTLTQQYGRIVRAEDDWGITVAFDKKIGETIIKRHTQRLKSRENDGLDYLFTGLQMDSKGKFLKLPGL